MEQARKTAEAMGLDWFKNAAEEPEPAADPCPRGFEFVWETFVALHGQRSSGFGPNPLAWMDVAAWASLHGVRLSVFELDLLARLDQRYLKVTHEAHARLSRTQSRHQFGGRDAG